MYIPILKNRQYETKLLREYSNLFDENIIPLIEIISLETRKKSYTPQQIIGLYDSYLEGAYFVDFFTIGEKEYSSYDTAKVSFSLDIRNEDNYRYFDDLIAKVSLFERAIPVISIKEGREFILNEKYLETIIRQSRNICSRIAIRIQPKFFDKYFELIKSLLRSTDFFLYDISEESIDPHYFDIYELQGCNNAFIKVILNSPRKRVIYNSSYENLSYSELIDNSLKIEYKDRGFDGFGDYAGIKDDLPTQGGNGQGAALGLFYCEYNNRFFSVLNEDTSLGPKGYQYVLKEVFNNYEDELDPDSDCPAFVYMNNQMIKLNKTGNWGVWKLITIVRYISQIKKVYK